MSANSRVLAFLASTIAPGSDWPEELGRDGRAAGSSWGILRT